MLRVISGDGAERQPPYLTTAAAVRLGEGFHEEEGRHLDRYRWMSPRASVEFDPQPLERFLELWVFSSFFDLSQELLVSAAGHQQSSRLLHGWAQVSSPIPAGSDSAQLVLNKALPAAQHPEDPRSLGISIRSPRIHADRQRHADICRQHDNAVHNTAEMLEGRELLRSTPPHLGIDLHGVCNIKPPCVYCEWDISKAQEGENADVPFSVETLQEWGELFDNSSYLFNCSIGEPFMMKNLDELLDVFRNRGKVLEVATNGQFLTDRNIQKLLGQEIHLYVSLDAASPETYARLRNDRFELILDNLRRLIAAKGAHRGLPRIYLVFMPMRANLHELEPFVRLCADLQVDRFVLRPLNYSDTSHLRWERGGYRFNYPDELLPFSELVKASGRATALCERLGVELTDQLDFGTDVGEKFAEGFAAGRQEAAEVACSVPPADSAPAEGPPSETGPQLEPQAQLAPQAPTAMPDDDDADLGQDRLPLCQEPWKSLYILRRGIYPCCYGGEPLAPMAEYRQTWNSAQMQEIRAALAAGRLHEYCLRSPSCPIVRKSEAASELTPRQALRLRARHLLHRLDRACFWLPGRVYALARRAASKAKRVVLGPR